MQTSSPVLASTGQRFGTMLIDLVCYFTFALAVGVVAGLVGLGTALEETNDLLLGLCVLFVYYFPQEAFSGRTVGKLLTKTRAVGEDGTALTPGQAFGRTLCRFIPFEAFSFLGGDGRPKGWHDRIPKTKIISLK